MRCINAAAAAHALRHSDVRVADAPSSFLTFSPHVCSSRSFAWVRGVAFKMTRLFWLEFTRDTDNFNRNQFRPAEQWAVCSVTRHYAPAARLSDSIRFCDFRYVNCFP